MKHILIGRDREGNTVCYTGRAGELFISQRLTDAFEYDSLEAARRKATNLNRMTSIHGIRFFSPSTDNTDYFLSQLS